VRSPGRHRAGNALSLVTQALGQQTADMLAGAVDLDLKTWATTAAGVPLVASFAGENLTEAQRDWLGSTPLPLRKVMFHRTNGASTALFQAVCCALQTPIRCGAS